jgi:hypothetical protein
MLLLGSISDSIVPFKEIQKIYQGYKGEKQLLHLDSDHSDNRSEFVLEQVSRWIQTILFHDIVDKEQFQKERPQFSQSEKKSIRDSTVNESRMGMSLDYDEDQNIGQEGKLTPLKGDIGKVDSAS